MTIKQLSFQRAARLLDRLQPSSNAVLFGAAILVGFGTALGGILFIRMIEWVNYSLFTWLPTTVPLGRAWLILVPVIGGAIAGPIIAFFA
ncbi:MAG: hypothetical protein JW862_18065, partial [Anaerolineales bacterium]|nr:hypothetical protein [Anaerolineales bacterium]